MSTPSTPVGTETCNPAADGLLGGKSDHSVQRRARAVRGPSSAQWVARSLREYSEYPVSTPSIPARAVRGPSSAQWPDRCAAERSVCLATAASLYEPVSVQGLAGSCARACDAASACTAFSHRDGSGVCTLYGPTLSRSESNDASRTVRENARMHATVCAHVWTCAHRCVAQITATDDNPAVVCMRKRHTAVRSFRSIAHKREHSYSHRQGKRSIPQRSTAPHRTAQEVPLGDWRTCPAVPCQWPTPSSASPCTRGHSDRLATLQVFSETGETIPPHTAGPESLESTNGGCAAPRACVLVRSRGAAASAKPNRRCVGAADGRGGEWQARIGARRLRGAHGRWASACAVL